MTTAQLTTWRHHLHGIAETAFNEHKTAEYIAEQLRLLGLEVTTGIGGTGVIGTLKRGSGKKTIGLRADLDGLPLLEKSAVSYKSKNDGAMHACGHDGHMTMVLGAAAELINDTSINGTVHFLFQPAEEPGLGAQAMIDDGLFERFPMDEIHGIHNVPGSPAGHLLTREGPLMASEDNFVITITGRGGHASRPQMLIDPLVIGSEIVLALQTIVSRSVDPDLSAVVSCTEFISDGSRNAVPSEVIIKGDTRTFEQSVSTLIETRMREICAGIASSYGASVEVEYTHEFQPTINHPEATKHALKAAIEVVGEAKVDGQCQRWMGSEDFGVFALSIPACFMFLGTGVDSTPLHNREYNFNDEVLEVGVNYYTKLIRNLLV